MSSYKRWQWAGDGGGKVFKWVAGAHLKGKILSWKEGKFGRLVTIDDEELGETTFPCPTVLHRQLFEELKVRVGELIDVTFLGMERNERSGNSYQNFKSGVERDGDVPVAVDEEEPDF